MVDNRILKLKYYYKRKKNCQISLMLNNLFGFFHFLERKRNNSVNMTIEKIQYNDLNDGKKNTTCIRESLCCRFLHTISV